jgi:hypothetical protein
MEEGRMFFFEKKNQKTFTRLRWALSDRLADHQ